MPTATLKETPLADIHRQSGARMVDFAGWNMPVQYKSIITEHLAVRQAAGLFDVSHMGEFIVRGSGAKAFLQYVIANDIERLASANFGLYTQLLNHEGGVIDDLIVYRRTNDYLLVVNASNMEKDWQWLQEQSKNFANVELVDQSADIALLALQGPKAIEIMKELVGAHVLDMKSFHYREDNIGGVKASFARTGYTGEDGFEIFVENSQAVRLWQTVLEAGKGFAIQPCGLGARDTLRLEACLPLYGHELDDNTTPLEAGLGWSVKLNKGDFIGKEKLIKQNLDGLSKQLVCIVSEGKALPRQGYPLKADDLALGYVTSGSQGIFVGKPIAMGYVPPDYASLGQKLTVEIRDQDVPSQVVPRPFYKRPA
jgi:aminomethyltransferase